VEGQAEEAALVTDRLDGGKVQPIGTRIQQIIMQPLVPIEDPNSTRLFDDKEPPSAVSGMGDKQRLDQWIVGRRSRKRIENDLNGNSGPGEQAAHAQHGEQASRANLGCHIRKSPTNLPDAEWNDAHVEIRGGRPSVKSSATSQARSFI
jgi:hypothetical protein